MGIQQNIDNITKLGFQLDINIDSEGSIVAGIFSQEDDSGMCSSILSPANETGNDLSEVLSELLKRLLKHIKEQGNE